MNFCSIFALAKRNDTVCSLKYCKANCGNSSVGRAQPCQGWGREFEPRFPLKGKDSNCYLFLYQLLERGRSAGW